MSVSKPALKSTRPAPLQGVESADLFLMPGQLYFGAKARSLRTLVGSCVALTLWHPTRRIGGMCHYLLPSRPRSDNMPADGRYGDEAVELLVQALLRANTKPSEYDCHLYGGADTMPDQAGVKLNVGERNIEQGWNLIEKYGFSLVGVDVGENMPRNVRLEIATGEVLMRRGGSH
jgi:chemotaxis protein CheD